MDLSVSTPTTYVPPFNIQNEKRKDKEVTARIERILKLRNQSMRGVDMGARITYNFTLSAGDEHLSPGKVEQKVDHLVRVSCYTTFQPAWV